MKSAQHPGPCVALLHGLGRTRRSMAKMERALQSSGFFTMNLDYPSTRHPLETLALAVESMLARQGAYTFSRLHLVTHSMGGIVARQIMAAKPLPNLGRVVMLSPPNQGSRLVDVFSGWAFFHWIYGPAGAQLGTGPGHTPARLGPVDFDLGVISGDKSVNPVYSAILGGPNDGKVTLQSARVKGARDFLAVHRGHTFIMNSPEVIRQTIHYLKHGTFLHSQEI